MTEYLATSRDSIPGRRVGDSIVVLRALATGPDAPVAIAAARGLATTFHDASGLARLMEIAGDSTSTDDVRASAIVTLEYMKDPSAAPVLWRIVAMQYDPGFISVDGEDRLRGVADEALNKLFERRPDEYPRLYG